MPITENRVDYDENRVQQGWDQDKADVENTAYDGVQDVENAPEDVAGWAGRKVDEVEDIPDDIEHDVEDVPVDIAGWAGRKVDDVENFDQRVDQYGDGIEGSYDAGRNEGGGY